MKIMLSLMLAAIALQQPQPAPQRPAGPTTQPVQPESHPRVTPFDTTAGAVYDIGRAVAEVRAEIDRFHQATSNDPSASVLRYAADFRTRCQALAAAAQKGARVMCRHCMTSAAAQSAIDQFKAYMPTLSQAASRCATTIQRATAQGNDAHKAEALRRASLEINNSLTSALRGYEARLATVRAGLMARQQPGH